MADYTQLDSAQAALSDPGTSAADLAEIAQHHRGLWGAIANHPAVYAGLTDWMAGQDPSIRTMADQNKMSAPTFNPAWSPSASPSTSPVPSPYLTANNLTPPYQPPKSKFKPIIAGAAAVALGAVAITGVATHGFGLLGGNSQDGATHQPRLFNTGNARGPLTTLTGVLTDPDQLLGATADEVKSYIDQVNSQSKVKLVLVFVPSFGDFTPPEWVDITAKNVDLTKDEILLAIATEDHTYGLTYDDASDLSAVEFDYYEKLIQSNTLEFNGADEDWARLAKEDVQNLLAAQNEYSGPAPQTTAPQTSAPADPFANQDPLPCDNLDESVKVEIPGQPGLCYLDRRGLARENPAAGTTAGEAGDTPEAVDSGTRHSVGGNIPVADQPAPPQDLYDTDASEPGEEPPAEESPAAAPAAVDPHSLPFTQIEFQDKQEFCHEVAYRAAQVQANQYFSSDNHPTTESEYYDTCVLQLSGWSEDEYWGPVTGALINEMNGHCENNRDWVGRNLNGRDVICYSWQLNSIIGYYEPDEPGSNGPEAGGWEAIGGVELHALPTFDSPVVQTVPDATQAVNFSPSTDPIQDRHGLAWALVKYHGVTGWAPAPNDFSDGGLTWWDAY